jgi:hypothetical protein
MSAFVAAEEIPAQTGEALYSHGPAERLDDEERQGGLAGVLTSGRAVGMILV